MVLSFFPTCYEDGDTQCGSLQMGKGIYFSLPLHKLTTSNGSSWKYEVKKGVGKFEKEEQHFTYILQKMYLLLWDPLLQPPIHSLFLSNPNMFSMSFLNDDKATCFISKQPLLLVPLQGMHREIATVVRIGPRSFLIRQSLLPPRQFPHMTFQSGTQGAMFPTPSARYTTVLVACI